jgi:hypothetical protein
MLAEPPISLIGQKLDEEFVEAKVHLPPDAPLSDKLLITYRKHLAFAIPIVLVHTVWWTLAIRWNFFEIFQHRYQMSITMMVGSFIAGRNLIDTLIFHLASENVTLSVSLLYLRFS